MYRGRYLLQAAGLCIPSTLLLTSTAASPVTTQALALFFQRPLSSVSTPVQRCESLAALHKAVEMGHNLIPDPEGMQLATDAEVEQLFPFSWNIAQFRGRCIGERGLTVHYKPQVGHAAACRRGDVLVVVIVGSVLAVALQPPILLDCQDVAVPTHGYMTKGHVIVDTRRSCCPVASAAWTAVDLLGSCNSLAGSRKHRVTLDPYGLC